MQRHDLSWMIGELKGLAGELQDPQDRTDSWVLIIDQGGHASRAIVFDRTGREIAAAFAPVSTYRTGPDRVEHQPQEIIDSIRTAIDDVHRALGSDVDRVAVAGLATQRSSILCWDRKSARPLSPVLSWQDRRNAHWLGHLQSQEHVVRQLTGLVLSPHYGASKLRWCLDELPAVREAAAHQRLEAGPLAAWILRTLGNASTAVVDAANASRTLLWDATTRAWSPQMLELFGIPREILPRVVTSRADYGQLAFGARQIPLTVSTGDQSAVPFVHGLPDAESLYLNIGTGAFLQRIATTPIADTPLLRSVLWLDNSSTLVSLEGTVNGAGSALTWLNERTGLDVHRAAVAMRSGDPVITTADIPVFINGVSGLGSPYWKAQVDSLFLDSATGSELAQVAAVLESIAFLIAANVTAMQASGPVLKRIMTGGGVAKSEYLCSAIADATGLEVHRSSLREVTATGLAFLTAGLPAHWTPAGGHQRYEPRDNPDLRRRHDRWRAAMDQIVGR